eukprot:628999-Pelagomonas_calceolata.AAC.2
MAAKGVVATIERHGCQGCRCHDRKARRKLVNMGSCRKACLGSAQAKRVGEHEGCVLVQVQHIA